MVAQGLSGLHAQLLLLGDVYAQPLLDQMISAIEHSPLLQPTHWGSAEGVRDPYDRQALIRTAESRRDAVVPHLLRTSGPLKYAAHWYATSPAIGALHIDPRGALTPELSAAFFEAISGLAGALPIEWAHINTTFAGQPQELAMISGGKALHLGYYARLGPECLFPRTILGPRLLQMIDEDVAAILERGGLPAARLPNGALQLDLLERPWASDAATLKNAQLQAHKILFPTGVFLQPVSAARDVPGPRWIPLLGDAAVHGDTVPFH
jgi:hypothetical protein